MVGVGRALESIPDRRVTKVAQLRQTLGELAEWLDQSAAGTDAGRTVVLRDFCLALAKGALGQH